jgi:hypothetical protein
MAAGEPDSLSARRSAAAAATAGHRADNGEQDDQGEGGQPDVAQDQPGDGQPAPAQGA